jgi:dienelactone hydrolase
MKLPEQEELIYHHTQTLIYLANDHQETDRTNLNMNRYVALLLLILSIDGCSSRTRGGANSNKPTLTLIEARRSFKTSPIPENTRREPVETPPPDVFRLIKYQAPAGELAAYLTPDPGDGGKRPAIIWITGGDCNSIGDVWSPSSRDNDQTAAAFRKAGIIMMFPSLRGGNDNPGIKEGFYGEVDDVLAAVKYLEKQPYVDPKRIYLGGHSTGGTLVMLVAESSNRFRAVFSFGPVGDVSSYGSDSGFLPINMSNQKEIEARSPGYWLSSIKSPVWVMEGSDGGSNIRSVQQMAAATDNPNLHFIEIRGADHFSTLAPTNELIAKQILNDTGSTCNITLTEDEVNRNFGH